MRAPRPDGLPGRSSAVNLLVEERVTSPVDSCPSCGVVLPLGRALLVAVVVGETLDVVGRGEGKIS